MKKYILIALFCLLCSQNVLATSNFKPIKEPYFDTPAATIQFNEINNKLSNNSIDLETMKQYVNKLEDLEEQAKVCVDKSQSELKTIRYRCVITNTTIRIRLFKRKETHLRKTII